MVSLSDWETEPLPTLPPRLRQAPRRVYPEISRRVSAEVIPSTSAISHEFQQGVRQGFWNEESREFIEGVISDLVTRALAEEGLPERVNICNNPVARTIALIAQLVKDFARAVADFLQKLVNLTELLNLPRNAVLYLKELLSRFYCNFKVGENGLRAIAPEVPGLNEALDFQYSPAPALGEEELRDRTDDKEGTTMRVILEALDNLRKLVVGRVNGNIVQADLNDEARFQDLVRRISQVEDSMILLLERLEAQESQFRQTVLRDLPPQTPPVDLGDPNIQISDTSKGSDVLRFIQFLQQDSILEGLDNNVLTWANNNRIRYEFLADRMREIQQRVRGLSFRATSNQGQFTSTEVIVPDDVEPPQRE